MSVAEFRIYMKPDEWTLNLKRNRLQARDGGGACRASCSLQKGIEWLARLIIGRGWGGTLAENHDVSFKLKRTWPLPAYNGPVSESIMAARNKDRDAGYRMWASTLPAPDDCI